jgi:hypothetical protein
LVGKQRAFDSSTTVYNKEGCVMMCQITEV